MKQWNKPFLCKRTRYSEHFRLEWWRLALHKTMTWEVTEVFSPYKRLGLLLLSSLSATTVLTSQRVQSFFFHSSGKFMLKSLVFGLFLLGGGRQIKVEHCRKQCFMLLTASSGWGRGDFMMRTCSWVRTDLSDRSDWTFQYEKED